jgi:hypothetical protein
MDYPVGQNLIIKLLKWKREAKEESQGAMTTEE